MEKYKTPRCIELIDKNGTWAGLCVGAEGHMRRNSATLMMQDDEKTFYSKEKLAKALRKKGFPRVEIIKAVGFAGREFTALKKQKYGSSLGMVLPGGVNVSGEVYREQDSE